MLLDFNDGSHVDHVKSSYVIAVSVTRLELGKIIDSESESRKSSQMRCRVSLAGPTRLGQATKAEDKVRKH